MLNGDFLLERKCFDAIAPFSLTFIITNKYLFQLLEIDCPTALSQLLQDEKMIDLMMEAGYQNLSFKLKDLNSVAENLLKYLVIGKCRYK